MIPTTQDLEVFILSYNRGEMIHKTIESLLNQTLKEFPITVLDNASTDNTPEVIATFKSPLIKFISSEKNHGAVWNLTRSQHLVKRKYVMIFHDDDQLHPTYLETAMKWLKKHPDVDIVAPNKMNICAGTTIQNPIAVDPSTIKLDKTHFASALYIQNKIAFPGVIYNSTAWKQLDFNTLFNQFGKWTDRPIMIEALRPNQSALVMNGAWIFYGRHSGQDTKLKDSQPPHTLWLNREVYYRKLLGNNLHTFSGFCFQIMNPRNLKSGYKRRIASGISYADYINDAIESGATSKQILQRSWLYPKGIQLLFNLYAQYYLKCYFQVTY